MIISIAVTVNWSITQIDVLNAWLFHRVGLNGATWFIDPEYPDRVCNLKKAIYGLKQASHQRFGNFTLALNALDFASFKGDTSLFIYIKGSHILFYLVYVDDIIMSGTSNELISNVITSLQAQFPVKNLGLIHYFLGIKVKRTKGGLLLSQTKYINDILHRIGLANFVIVDTPITPPKSPKKNEPLLPLFSDTTLFCRAVGDIQ